MQVTLDVRALFLGIAIGVGAMAWGNPMPAKAAAGVANWDYKITISKVSTVDHDLRKTAVNGWEPWQATSEGDYIVLYYRRPR